ncbi:SDR family oxidoreductase [[Eubacterium] cellulosolvens]
MSETILLTGATGFLGAQITRRILDTTKHTIIALVRAESEAAANRRLARAWWDFKGLPDTIGGRVKVVCGDITKNRLGLDDKSYHQLVKDINYVIHTAADLRLDGPLHELRRTNVNGTINVIKLAQAAHKDHGLVRFSHVSTAYVAGGRKGPVPEDSLTDKYGFWSNYEISKYEGEQKINASGLPLSVFRPGLVVGDSKTGAIKTFNTIYFPLRLYLTGQLLLLPASKGLKVNLVPVDYVAEAVTRLTFNSAAEGLKFHLTAPYELLPTAGELIKFVRKYVRKKYNLELPRPMFLPLPVSLVKEQYRTRKMVERKRKGILNALITLAPYFNERREFKRDNIDRLLGPYEFNWRKLLPPLIDFAFYTGFLHGSERTVHEQILFRLSSRSRPVTYYDIVDGKFIQRTAAEVKKDIIKAMGALHSFGIRPGTRVAIVGFNSTRFLILDVAIGLLGAISVPIYYTSPINEIEEIIKASGAKLLCVGTSEILKKISDSDIKIPVISFCRRGAANFGKAVSWEKFLAKGAGQKLQPTAPVTFKDTATIRYTSGTTGKPKGVMFNHGNLRWMAESLASLPPWEARNKDITYLSFLPMNHVVEGILSAYSPYFAPAMLNIFFLEDFRELPKVLPQVKPTIFFSVPRYYEKVWSNLEKNKIGQRYIESRGGFKKSLLRRILHKGVLKRTGLERCAQLIVGSAPISSDLIQDFHDLGIEVHNAYGLTEAPLVTMNRMGANRIGTVGEPLPETILKIAKDGEVLVKGPQVTMGYFGEDNKSPVQNGWLYTGDIGRITKEGSLVIDGRKKEVIVTSYAKNIHPLKIEAMLRDIQGITEAMVVGENKPYCTAFLWVKDKNVNFPIIDKAVSEVNTRLSHPEQLKNWAVLINDLTIDGGDLTASLKIKRNSIIQRNTKVIDALYNTGKAPKEVLHLGVARREK